MSPDSSQKKLRHCREIRCPVFATFHPAGHQRRPAGCRLRNAYCHSTQRNGEVHGRRSVVIRVGIGHGRRRVRRSSSAARSRSSTAGSTTDGCSSGDSPSRPNSRRCAPRRQRRPRRSRGPRWRELSRLDPIGSSRCCAWQPPFADCRITPPDSPQVGSEWGRCGEFRTRLRPCFAQAHPPLS